MSFFFPHADRAFKSISCQGSSSYYQTNFGESIVISNSTNEIHFRVNDGRSSVCCPDFFRLEKQIFGCKTRNVHECIFCPLQRYRGGWTSDVLIARPILTNPLRSVVVTDDGGAKESLKSGTRRELYMSISSWHGCRSVSVSWHWVSSFHCSVRLSFSRRRCLSFVLTSVWCMERDVDSWVKFSLKEARLTMEM